MSNQTVYPYGTNGELPSSIGLINDLTTGGVNKALTAEQGKVIGDIITDKSIYDLDVITPFTQDIQYLATVSSVGSSLSSISTYGNTGMKNYRIPVEGAYQITYRKYDSSYGYGCMFLDANDVVVSVISSVGSDPNMKTVGIPEGAKTFMWSVFESTITDPDERKCTVRYKATDKIFVQIDGINDEINSIEDDLYGVEREEQETISFGVATTDIISIDAGNFYKLTSGTNRAYVIPINDWQKVTITTSTYCWFCITKSLVPSGTTSGSTMASTYMAQCQGYTPNQGSSYRMRIEPNSSVDITFGDGAKYLYITKNFNTSTDPTDYTPSSAIFYSFIRKDGLMSRVGENSGGIYDGVGFMRGTIDNDGKIIESQNHFVSTPIPTNVGHLLKVDIESGYRIESMVLYNTNNQCVNRKYLYYINGLVGYKSQYGSNVCLNGYYIRYVLINLNRDAELSDNPLRTFVLLNDKRLTKVMPDNASKYPIFKERIRSLTNIAWVALEKVAAVNSKKTYYYDKGTTTFGIPYSEVAEYSKFVGYHVSVRTFLTALLNRRSVMYTENVSSEASSSKYGLTYHNVTNASGAYYGTVCTGLTSFAMGFPETLVSDLWGDNKISGEVRIAKGNSSNYYYIMSGNNWVVSDRESVKALIQPMDVVKSPGHCSVISDIYLDEDGNRQFVIWTEETSGDTPCAKSTTMDFDGFWERLDYYATHGTGGWVISRYPMDGAVSIGNDKNYVPLHWYESPKEVSIDPDICTYAGDYVAFPIGDASETINNNKVFLNIHRGGGYDTLQIFSESADESTDNPIATIDISSNSGTYIYNSTNIYSDDASDKDDWIIVDLKQMPTQLTHGKYKARVINSNNSSVVSGFTHFQMVDINFYVDGTAISNMVANYSSEEGVPYYLKLEQPNGYGASMSQQRSIQEGETSTTAPRLWNFSSAKPYLKVFVRADYGVVVKRINVYSQFNS